MSEGAMTPHYEPEEIRTLIRQLAGCESARCPRCRTRMTLTEVPPRDEVSYVRDRIWLVCGDCRRTAVLDRREVERQRSD